jgi:glycosyltransferase involved in cell wall biosynthesis
VTITIRKLEREILKEGGSVCILTTVSGDSNNTNLVDSHPNRQVIFMDNSIPIPFQNNYEFGIGLSKTVQKQLDDFNPNIIHITAPDFTSLHINDYARSRSLPLMATYHSNIPEYLLFIPGMRWVKPILELLFRHIYNFSLKLYVPTPFIKNNLIETQSMDLFTDVQVWGRGVDLKRFTPRNRSEAFRQKLGIMPNDNTPIIIYVGRLVPEKRPDIVASVIRRLSKAGINFHAVIVGAGPAEHLVQNLPHTHTLGWLSGDELTEAYASSDVFLFPSSVETFGNVTLEAAASGLPLVVESKCSGHLVNHEVNGYACEAGNLEQFYQGTLALVNDAEKRLSFSKASIELSMTLEQSVVVRKMLTNYEAVQAQFYEEFGGSHFNRDTAYRGDKTFRMGVDPRPIGWFFVEFFVMIFLKLANFLLNTADWFQQRSNRSRNSQYAGVVASDDSDSDTDDVEAQRSKDRVTNNNIGNEDDPEVQTGLLCSLLIRIGDSEWTAAFIMFIVEIILFFPRTLSYARRYCWTRLGKVGVNDIEHRIDAAIGSGGHGKRIV